jgi:molecular chaperone GrpE
MNDKTPPQEDIEQLETEEDELDEVQLLQEKLVAAQEAERRAKADYHNLVRRTQDERAMLIKLATKSFVGDLLQPLSHLTLAAQQLKDKGLDMVIGQLWQTLENQGLKEINPVGQKFDITTMEAVDKEDDIDENNAEVVKVVKTGYSLNGEVIDHAKVVVGKKAK